MFTEPRYVYPYGYQTYGCQTYSYPIGCQTFEPAVPTKPSLCFMLVLFILLVVICLQANRCDDDFECCCRK